MGADVFSKLIKNFSHKEARCDSRTEPLFRLFHLLPVAIETLRDLASGPDQEDKMYARDLLRKFGGAAGYDRLVSAAVVADGMMVIGKFVNASQASSKTRRPYYFCLVQKQY